jgi:hypothetical protein
MSELERMAKEYCLEYIQGMSACLAQGLSDKYDLFESLYIIVRAKVNDPTTGEHLDGMAQKLWDRRREYEARKQ